MEGYAFKYEFAGEDVLVLAGDIHTSNRHHHLLSSVPIGVKILLVAGNHEYYHGNYQDVNHYLRTLQVPFSNYKFLQDEGTTIDGVEFFGGTMYTDFSLYQNAPLAEIDAMRGITDFHVSRISDPTIPGTDRRWTVDDHKRNHTQYVKKLTEWLKKTEDNPRRVVISHFVPTPKVVHPRWGVSTLNAYFTCDMERYMGWSGLWMYGHTHDSGDVKVGDTRVVGNPKGYGSENIHWDPNLIVEI